MRGTIGALSFRVASSDEHEATSRTTASEVPRIAVLLSMAYHLISLGTAEL
jgi:hypothetical protein